MQNVADPISADLEEVEAEPEHMLTVDETAGILRVNPMTVRRMIKDKKIVSVTIGRSRRIRRSDLNAYMRNLPAA